MSDFSDIMSVSLSELEEPKLTPIGTWLFQIVSAKSRKGRHENGPKAEVAIVLRPLEADQDVSEADLDNIGSIENLTPVFYQIPIFDKRDWWNLIRFAQNCGIEEDVIDSLEIPELIEALKGCTVKAYVVEKYLDGREAPVVNAEQFAKAA